MRTSDYLEQVAQIAENANRKQGDDYYKDGLLYCGKCNTPKQCVINWFGDDRVVYCTCKCREEEIVKEKEADRQREKMLRIKELRETAFFSSESSKISMEQTFENDDGSNPKITKIAKNYVEHFDEMFRRGKGLLFFGDVGTGKTYFATCIANALIEQGRPCLITDISRLVSCYELSFEKKDYLDNLREFDLIVIDDFEAQRQTEYMEEKVYTIIDARYRSGLPLIVTTNVSAEELKNPAEMQKKRRYSRLFEMCIPVEVKGKDRRKQILIRDYSDLKEMLGIEEVESDGV